MKQCEVCSKDFMPRPGNIGRFCSRACNLAGQSGSKAPNWRGGRHETSGGYVKRSVLGHPRAAGRGRYVSEHILVMEKRLGRYLLPGEEVHHRNGIRSDNSDLNLELWTRSQPRGKRVRDLIDWAKSLLATYEPIEALI